MTTIDSKQYNVAEHQSWNSVAAGWQKWWQTVEKGAQKVSDRLIELAEPFETHDFFCKVCSTLIQ
jgi:hypothetical protein